MHTSRLRRPLNLGRRWTRLVDATEKDPAGRIGADDVRGIRGRQIRDLALGANRCSKKASEVGAEKGEIHERKSERETQAWRRGRR